MHKTVKYQQNIYIYTHISTQYTCSGDSKGSSLYVSIIFLK